MSETVYLLGAGANQSVKNELDFRPPMRKNFFQITLNNPKFGDDSFLDRIMNIFEYINKFWRLNKSDLLEKSFDLEECFTLLDQQLETVDREDENEFWKLKNIQSNLIKLLAHFLQDFEIQTLRSDTMIKFGKYLYKEKPTILTFNYDCIIETAIEMASGVNPLIPELMHREPSRDYFTGHVIVPNEELPYSHSNWNRLLGYGIKFDETQLQRAGLPAYVRGERFYSHPENELYPSPILKLHGSLNWFQYLHFNGEPVPTMPWADIPFDGNIEDILLIRGRWWFDIPPSFKSYYLNPLIITPTLFKNEFYRREPFVSLWNMAKTALLSSKRLVIIGYSFSSTDFSTMQLFREVFSTHEIEELIIVNPNLSVVEIAKKLCHFDKPVLVCKNLEEYLMHVLRT